MTIKRILSTLIDLVIFITILGVSHLILSRYFAPSGKHFIFTLILCLVINDFIQASIFLYKSSTIGKLVFRLKIENKDYSHPNIFKVFFIRRILKFISCFFAFFSLFDGGPFYFSIDDPLHDDICRTRVTPTTPSMSENKK